jgi:methylamine dehydrogenase accessory protein MauD
MILLTIAIVVQFVILIALTVVVLSLARQVGILHERLSPAGISRAREGIVEGEKLPSMSLESEGGSLVDPTAVGRTTALLFVAADCPICKSVLPAFEEAMIEAGDGIAGFWVTDGLPGADGEMPDYERYAAEYRIDPDRFLVSQELGLKLGIRQIPALALLDQEGRLETLETLSGPRQLTRTLAAQRARPSGEKST